ncbi:MAG: transcriptional regulator, TetR family [Acidimicrobiaceae bacterium]|nr:transcriptional regulator, TetR family [Acidimicrobiaceae bacterium]
MVVDVEQQADGHSAGRPRDELREQAILDAAVDLLIEVGYDCLTIDTLATRARASKATIYRRWSGKAEIVAEAVRRRKCPDGDEIEPNTGSLRQDLIEFLHVGAGSTTNTDAALIFGVLRAMRLDPELSELMRVHVIERKHAVVRAMVGRAVARGELPPAADPTAMIEVVEALVFGRLALNGGELDDQFIGHVIDDVALPMLRR